MSQPADWGVPGTGPATPTAYASRDNGSFDALLSGHIGASRPSYVAQGTFWLKDTGASPQVIEKYFYDGTNDILTASFDVATSKVSFMNFVGSAVASAATIVIPSDGDYFSLTGSTTISTMTVAINRSFTLKSVSGLTLTAGAPIVTIDGNDLVLAAGQTVTLQSTAANVIQVVSVGAVAGAGTISEYFVSSEQTITKGGSLTIAHGLSSAPKIRGVYLIFTTAEDGYSIGDTIQTNYVWDSSNDGGFVLEFDDTNIYILYSDAATNVMRVLSKTTNLIVALTNANIRLVVEAMT